MGQIDDQDLLLSTLTSLGFDQVGEYVPDIDVINSVRVLIRFLMQDNKKCSIRIQIGSSNIWTKDLIPLLLQHSDNDDLFNTVVRLMMNLALPRKKMFIDRFNPEELKDALKSDSEIEFNYRKVQEHLITYKESFVEAEIWTTFKNKLSSLLAKPWESREKDDEHHIERMLYLIRNILLIPNSKADTNRASGDDTIHDKIGKAFTDSGFGKLMVFMASNEECLDYRGYVMEIIAQVLREQDPKALAVARTSTERDEDNKLLMEDARKENLSRNLKLMNQTSRHSRFGGTFSLQQQGNRNIVTKKLVQKESHMTLDRVKQRAKIASRKCKGQDISRARMSSQGVRTSLQKFCDCFLENGFNIALNGIRNKIQRDTDISLEDNDETHYFHIMTIFMSYTMARPIWTPSEKVAFISECLSQETVSYVERTIYRYQENIDCDKTRQSAWTNRLNYAIRGFKTIILTVLDMAKSGDEALKTSADQLKEQILYAPEYREIIPGLFKRFNPLYQTKNYLRDLLLTQHTLLKLLDGSSSIIVRGQNVKTSKKSTKKKTNQKKVQNKVEPLRDEVLKDAAWNDIQEDLDLHSTTEIELDDVMKLGILNPMDEEVIALGQVQLALHGRLSAKDQTPGQLGLQLLRACQSLWPEDQRFGNRLTERDILETLCKEDLPEKAFPQPEAPESDSEDEEGGEESGQHYDEIVEYEIKIQDIVELYATPFITSQVGLLLKEYEFNPPDVNRAISKYFHRIAFGIKMPAMCYQASIFLTFQKLNANQGLVRSNPVIRELWQVGKFILGKFFETLKTNPKLPIEALFWTNLRDCESIQNGSYADRSYNKSALWTDGLDDELRQLATEAETFQERNPEDFDLVDYVAEQFTDDSKTTVQIKRRLIKLGLLQKSNAKKSHSIIWSEEMEQKLSDLFKTYFMKVKNIISFIQDRGVEYSRKQIIEKLVGLGLIENGDQIRVLKKDELQPMTEEMENKARKTHHQSKLTVYENIVTEDISVILRRIKSTPSVRKTLQWLCDEIELEVKDRNEEPENEWEDRSLVSSALEISKSIEKHDFLILLKSAGFRYPDHEHVYWRIGKNLSVNELEFFSSTLNEFEPEVEYDESEDEPEEDPYEFMDQDDGRNNQHRQHSVESSTDDELENLLAEIKTTDSSPKRNSPKKRDSPKKRSRKAPRKPPAVTVQAVSDAVMTHNDDSDTDGEVGENRQAQVSDSDTDSNKDQKMNSDDSDTDSEKKETPKVDSDTDEEPMKPFEDETVKRKSSGDLDSDSDEEISKVKKPRKRILDSDSD